MISETGMMTSGPKGVTRLHHEVIGLPHGNIWGRSGTADMMTVVVILDYLVRQMR